MVRIDKKQDIQKISRKSCSKQIDKVLLRSNRERNIDHAINPTHIFRQLTGRLDFFAHRFNFCIFKS